MAEGIEYLVESVQRIHGLATRYDAAERAGMLSEGCEGNGPRLVAEFRSQWREPFLSLATGNEEYQQWLKDLDRLHTYYEVSLRYASCDLAKLLVSMNPATFQTT